MGLPTLAERAAARLLAYFGVGQGGTPVSTLTITTTTLSDGPVNIPYSTTLAATGGSTPYTWAVTSGTLPVGATLDADTGEIAGTPNTVGKAQFTVTATDAADRTATADLSINTVQNPQILYALSLAAVGTVSQPVADDRRITDALWVQSGTAPGSAGTSVALQVDGVTLGTFATAGALPGQVLRATWGADPLLIPGGALLSAVGSGTGPLVGALVVATDAEA